MKLHRLILAMTVVLLAGLALASTASAASSGGATVSKSSACNPWYDGATLCYESRVVSNDTSTPVGVRSTLYNVDSSYTITDANGCTTTVTFDKRQHGTFVPDGNHQSAMVKQTQEINDPCLGHQLCTSTVHFQLVGPDYGRFRIWHSEFVCTPL